MTNNTFTIDSTATDATTFFSIWKDPPYKIFFVDWSVRRRRKDIYRMWALSLDPLRMNLILRDKDDYRIRKHLIKKLMKRNILVPIIVS